MRSHILGIVIALTLGISGSAHAETVNVKYRGPVDLAPFQCESVTRSSLVNDVFRI